MRRVSLFLIAAGLMSVAGCGGSSSASKSTTTTTTTTASGANVLPIAVNGGPTGSYQDAAFATATVCVPGSTSNCVTIDNLLVDTGSTGLRVFASAVSSLGLPALNASNGSAAYDCVAFVDGDYMWGQVEQADVSLGAETADNLPIQVIGSGNASVPGSCSNGSTTNVDTANLLGANGILGVGVEPTDCAFEGANDCSPTSGLSSAPYPAYYTCSGSSCTPAFVAKANQVANPVVSFSTDNNGVVVELPAVSASEASVSGSLVFGIGTESNNQLPSSATILTLTCDLFTTDFDGTSLGPNPRTCAGPESFIDSGSNGLFFPNLTGITVCPSKTTAGNLSDWYCPSSADSLSATNSGANGSSLSTNFTVNNAETMFTDSSADSAFPGLAGPLATGNGFDWGLPFFFGVHVYSAIDGQTMPSGAPAGPWWAY